VPVIDGSAAPVFSYTLPGSPETGPPTLSVRGLASPSRGSKETCVWRMTISPGVPPRMGTVDREEIFLVLTGRATATLGGEEHNLNTGDVLIAPAHTTFGIANPYGEPVEMVVVFPAGGHAIDPAQEAPFTPPWAE
jgi:quercetin dioxygenase-like cupin family protein